MRRTNPRRGVNHMREGSRRLKVINRSIMLPDVSLGRMPRNREGLEASGRERRPASHAATNRGAGHAGGFCRGISFHLASHNRGYDNTGNH